MGKEERTDLEFEARKEKKRHKEKRKKDELDRNSSLIEVCGDKMGEVVQGQKFDKSSGTHMNSGKEGAEKKKKRKREKDRNSSLIEVCGDKMGEVVCGQKFDKNSGTNMNSGKEGAEKKKKRKREKEGVDILIKKNMTDEKELMNDREKSNGKRVEEVDFTDNEKKRKKILEDDKMGEAAEFKYSEYGDVANMNKEGDKKKKKKKKEKKREEVGDELIKNIMTDGEAGVESEDSVGQIMEKGGFAFKEKKRKKRNHGKKSGSELQESVAGKLGIERSGTQENEFLENDGNVHATGGESCNRNMEDDSFENGKTRMKKARSEKHVNIEDCNKDKKKKTKSDKGSLRTPKKVVADRSENSTPEKASKRVSFADDVEVFSPSDDPRDEKKSLVQGKWFSEEEDKLVKEAVLSYIEEQNLGDEGLYMVLHCKSYPEIKGCWKKIGQSLPWRPYQSIYYRAHTLFERDEKRSTWTPEQYELVRRFHEKHGADWRTLADALGKHRIHVKDAWRRIKLPDMKKGRWSQEEYQTLFDLVNMDLRMKAFEERKSKHGMLRDNICWETISDTLSTRSNAICCQKWYHQLSSPMVVEGLWADTDDYLLLCALESLDACCMEDVDWDNVLEHRPGDVCRKRWNQMVKHIGEHGTKSFAEQVETLSKRYCSDVLEAREIYASKPIVD